MRVPVSAEFGGAPIRKGEWKTDQSEARIPIPSLYQSEVRDFHETLIVEQEVVRLHIAVDHAAIVSVL